MYNTITKLVEKGAELTLNTLFKYKDIKSQKYIEKTKINSDIMTKGMEGFTDYTKIQSNNKKEITINRDNNDFEIKKIIMEDSKLDVESKIKLKNSFTTPFSKTKEHSGTIDIPMVAIVSIVSLTCLNGYKYKNRSFIEKIF